MDSLATMWVLNCPTNSIWWIAYGSVCNSFCLVKSTAIAL